MKILVILLVQALLCIGIWLYFRRKFTAFSDSVCQSTERLLHGQPVKEYLNKETLTSKMIAELEKAEDIVRYRVTENEREKQELQEMISEITHQIKTPLSNIRMYCEMTGDQTDVALFHVELQEQTQQCCACPAIYLVLKIVQSFYHCLL